MINLNDTFNKVVKDLGKEIKKELPKFIIKQHLKGTMIDGTKLPPYSPSYIKKKRNYKGHADLQQYNRMHKSIHATIVGDRVKAYVNTISYTTLYVTSSKSGKLWEHWYRKNVRMKHPFTTFMNKLHRKELNS